jgi:hypothetical protein
LTNTVIANVPIGQAAQAIVYVPNAVPERAGTELGNAAMSVAGASLPGAAATEGLQPLGLAGQAARLTMAPAGQAAAVGAEAPTSVTLFDQGLVQVLEAAVTGLEPGHPSTCSHWRSTPTAAANWSHCKAS